TLFRSKIKIAMNVKKKLYNLKITIMKNLKLVSILILTTLFSFTSCQDETDVENGQHPNTNTANSETANNLERSAMHDGSFDDFLDRKSCSSILLPVVATVNGTEISILTQDRKSTRLNSSHVKISY